MQVVIPARDEADRVGVLVEILRRAPRTSITVVDGASADATAAVARAAGATVVSERREGKGFAVVSGLLACAPGRVFVCDGDVRGVTPAMVEELGRLARRRRAPLARLAIGRAAADAPVTTLVARPLLAALGVADLREPLGGLAVVDRDFVLERHLPGGWGFDVSLTVAALTVHGEVPEMSVRGVSHRTKPVTAYVEMAEEVVAALLRSRGIVSWEHDDCVLCGRESRAIGSG